MTADTRLGDSTTASTCPHAAMCETAAQLADEEAAFLTDLRSALEVLAAVALSSAARQVLSCMLTTQARVRRSKSVLDQSSG